MCEFSFPIKLHTAFHWMVIGLRERTQIFYLQEERCGASPSGLRETSNNNNVASDKTSLPATPSNHSELHLQNGVHVTHDPPQLSLAVKRVFHVIV